MTSLTLSFNDVNFAPFERSNQIWITACELSKALGYSQTDAASKIYNRNKDEFSENMTQVIENPQTPNLGVRIFSLRGCHLVAMFARTKIAKQFRRWVLDILDRETNQDRLSTKSDRIPLKDAVNMLVAKTVNLNYSDAYKMLHQKMGIESVKELMVSQLPQAVEYVHELVVRAVAVQGELLPKDVPEWETPEYKAHHRRAAIALMTVGREMEIKQSDILRKMENMLIDVRDALQEAQRCSGAIFDGLHESQFHLCFDSEIMKEGRRLGQERASLRKQR